MLQQGWINAAMNVFGCIGSYVPGLLFLQNDVPEVELLGHLYKLYIM